MIYAFAFQETTFPIDILTSSPANKVSNLQTRNLIRTLSIFIFQGWCFFAIPIQLQDRTINSSREGVFQIIKRSW